MNFKRKNGEVFVTALDDRERTEVRRLSRSSLTKDERQRALVDFLARHDFAVGDDETIFVWA